MNKSLYVPFMFVFLLLLQVLILNNILLFGYVNPYLYVVFIIIYPFNKRFQFLTTAFLLGLCVDFFANSGGAHAFVSVFIAYIRIYVFQKIFQKLESGFDLFDLNQEAFGKRFNYVAILTLVHHFILFFLINFSFNNLPKVLINTLLSSIFTLLLYFTGSFIFSRK